MSSSTEETHRSAAGRAPRRAPGEVRELLLDAAREIFARHGYADSSTKRIAERAEVAEALLFRHFGSKAQLFREAVVEPLVELLRGYTDQWLEFDSPHEVQLPVREFVETVFGALSHRRGLAMALTGASNYSDDVVENTGALLADVLRAIEGVVVQEADRFGYQGLNPPVTARVGVGSVLAAAVFRNWLFGRDASAIQDERITADLTGLLLHGIRNRPTTA